MKRRIRKKGGLRNDPAAIAAAAGLRDAALARDSAGGRGEGQLAVGVMHPEVLEPGTTVVVGGVERMVVSEASLPAVRKLLLERENELWASVFARAMDGNRSCLRWVFKLLYGWSETERYDREKGEVEDRLGATVEEAAESHRTVREAAAMSEHDVADRMVKMLRWYGERHPERFKALLAELTGGTP